MNRPAGRKSLHPLWLAVLSFLVLLGCLGGLAATVFFDLLNNYGVAYGRDLPRIPYTDPANLNGANPLGVNVFLHLETDPANVDRTLDMVKAGGYGFIRQSFPWEYIEPERGQFKWDTFDQIVEKASARQIQIIARLDQPPYWARPTEYDRLKQYRPNDFKRITGPPENYADFADFAGAVAERYKGKLKFYQIWNEPNLANEWNDHKVNAVDYVNLLKLAYTKLKQVDPDAVIIAAPLAATDQDGPQFNNLNELKYLDEMYQAGAKAYFDIASVMMYGLGYSPEYRFLQPDFRYKDLKRVNLNRAAASHEVMVKNGDSAKPVWAMEYGWISVPPGPNLDSYNQNPLWGDNVSEAQQADYLVGGIERARKEWPWLGVINVWFLRPDPNLAARPDDPTNYFSLFTPDFQPRPAYLKLQQYAANAYKTADTGWHPAGDPALSFASGQPDALSAGDKFSFSFQGERAEIGLNPTRDGTLKVAVDGGSTRDVTFKAGGETRLTLAEGLNYAPHSLQVNVDGAAGSPLAQLSGFYVSRDNHLSWLVSLLVVTLGFGATGSAGSLGWQFWRARRNLMLWFRRLTGWLWRNRERYAPYAMLVALAIYYFAPPMPLAVAGALLFFPLAMVRPDWALLYAIIFAPLYLHARDLRLAQSPLDTLRGLTHPRDPNDTRSRLEFTLTEITIVMATGAWFLRSIYDLRFAIYDLMKTHGSKTLIVNLKSSIVNFLKRPFTLPLALFFLVACLSLLTPDPSHLKEALREFRLVIVEPLLLYLLVVRFIKGRAGVWRVFDLMIAVGVVIALLGVWQFFFVKDKTVAAEGVSRVISVYNHPDNLGLYLGRIIPLAAGLAFFGQGWGKRRWLYLAALVPLGAALGLAFSRGAWIGTGVALLVMIIAAGSKRGLLVYGVGFALLLAALPFIKLERITSLFSFVTGSNSTRLHVWQASLQMLRDHPLTGIGLDQFLYKYSVEYVPPDAWLERFTSHPHNFILDYWLRLGIIGPVLILWLLIVFYKTILGPGLISWKLHIYAFKSVQGQHEKDVKGERSIPERKILALGLLGSMTDFVVHGLVDNSYFLPDLAVIFCLTLALVEVLRYEALAEKENNP